MSSLILRNFSSAASLSFSPDFTFSIAFSSILHTLPAALLRWRRAFLLRAPSSLSNEPSAPPGPLDRKLGASNETPFASRPCGCGCGSRPTSSFETLSCSRTPAQRADEGAVVERDASTTRAYLSRRATRMPSMRRANVIALDRSCASTVSRLRCFLRPSTAVRSTSSCSSRLFFLNCEVSSVVLTFLS